MDKNKRLLEGSISHHMLRLILPSLGGMLAFILFNLTDTYFVSRLGMDALAAMGYTFPVVLIVGSVAAGMSLGSGSVLSRAMGSGDTHIMRRTATDGILLSIIMVVLLSTIGLLTMDPLFRALGAEGEALKLVKDYMGIWLVGVVAVIMPPVSDACLRATGDMMRPFIVMMVCAVMNALLDPILIFGFFGLPAMGIKGAALATIIARTMGMITSLSFLHFHAHLLDFKIKHIKEVLRSWGRILHVGFPSTIIQLMPPLLRSTMTTLASSAGGTAAVAALAAGNRLESFALIISMAVGSAIVPMVGQNWGAKHYDRVAKTRVLSNKLAIVYGVIIFLIALPLSKPLARIFSQVISVIDFTAWYLWIFLLSSIGLNLTNWNSQAMNAAGKPKWATILNIAGTILIMIPLAKLGKMVYGFVGMLIGVGLGQLLVGFISKLIADRELCPPLVESNTAIRCTQSPCPESISS